MLTKENIFKNRKLYIVTQHHKDKVIAPLMENELQVKCELLSLVDTDSLGTFTGEVERKLDALQTLRAKCELAKDIEGCELVVATEGSFGNHPSIFFASANDELIMLKDFEHNIEIVDRVLSLETNFNESQISTFSELESFAEKEKFPSHGLIIKASKHDFKNMVKGITDKDTLLEVFNRLSKINGSCHVETDMRACYNPTRMEVIREATQKLIAKIKSLCPVCQCPGFGVVDAIQGLPCKLCNQPTRSTLAYKYQCQKCQHQQQEMYPKQKMYEDPMYCDYCNP